MKVFYIFLLVAAFATTSAYADGTEATPGYSSAATTGVGDYTRQEANPCLPGDELQFIEKLGRKMCVSSEKPDITDRKVAGIARCPDGMVSYFDLRKQHKSNRCWPEDEPLPSWARK